MPLFPISHPWLTQLRSFSSTARTLAKSSKTQLEKDHRNVPTYPYGPSQIYKQSNFGLYGNQKIRHGNMVSEKNEIKTRRYWRPNVHYKKLHSPALRKRIRIRVTTRVFRTIKKCGGLDEYLLGEKEARIKELGMAGWKLRWRIMQTRLVKERFFEERKKLGLVDPKLTYKAYTEALFRLAVAESRETQSERDKKAAALEAEIQRFDRELAEEGIVDMAAGEVGPMVEEERKFMEEEERRSMEEEEKEFMKEGEVESPRKDGKIL